jgi:hypothetical protein
MRALITCASLTLTVAALVGAYRTNDPGWWLVAVAAAAVFSFCVGRALGGVDAEFMETSRDYWRDSFNKLSIDRATPKPRLDVQEAWKCRKCGIAFDSIAEALSCRWCHPKCPDCGIDVARTGRTRCSPCDRLRDQAKYLEQPTVRLAEYLSDEPNGFLCIDGERFIAAADFPLYRPELSSARTVETCEPRRGFTLEAYDIVEGALQEHHEDATEDVDTDELQALLDKWVEGQSVESWFTDGRRIHPDDLVSPCPECQGKTVDFRGEGLSLESRVCSRWREDGHLSEQEIKRLVSEKRRAAYPRSGRFA